MAIKKNWMGEPITDGLDCQAAKDGRTVQSEAAACDINNIMKNRDKGLPVLVSDLKAQFGDFTNIPDFHTAMGMIAQAQQGFDSLPALTRERFDNKPEKFVSFFMDPKNQQEAIDLGLANKILKPPTASPAPAPAAPVAPATPTP